MKIASLERNAFSTVLMAGGRVTLSSEDLNPLKNERCVWMR